MMPNLPAIPPDKLPGNAKSLLRIATRSSSVVNAWARAANTAANDPAMRQVEMRVRYPEGASLFLGSNRINPKTLGNESQWVYVHLLSLVDTVGPALRGSTTIPDELKRFGEMLGVMGDKIVWDALLDLALADRLAYHHRSGHPQLAWTAEGVLELRAGVVYLINSLEKVYGYVLRGALAERLLAQRVLMPNLTEALEYFDCYAEAYDELTRPALSAEPTEPRSWWQRHFG